MARPIRVEYAGASYHVMARGNERKEIYRGEEDRRMFLVALAEMVERFAVKLYGYVLMPNHFHLLLSTPEGNLSRAMGWLQTTYTIRYNRKHRRVGHLFQGRYKAQVVEKDSYAIVLVPYVHLNPIRKRTQAGVKVTGELETLKHYAWSSHLDYTGERKRPLIKLDWEWLKYWGATPRKARWSYRQEIRRLAKAEVIENPWDKLEGQLALGKEKFIEEVKELVKGKQRGEEQKWRGNREISGRRKLIKDLIGEEQDRRWQIWLRVKKGMERPVDLAREMNYRDGGSVLQVIKRLERDEANRTRIEKYELQMSRIES